MAHNIWHEFFIAFILIFLTGAPASVNADAVVTGSVYCDQCKDGARSLYDYPLFGAKVSVSCPDTNGTPTSNKEGTTDWVGGYAIRVGGSGAVDLSRCNARVVDGPDGCNATVGPAKGLSLVYDMLGMKMYAVGPLLAQPPKPMALCPAASNGNRTNGPPPPVTASLKASACSYDKWTNMEYKCHWKVVTPATQVWSVFGPIAAAKYGTKTTLFQALHGKGDVYKTLLREATTSLLNSYNSAAFNYSTLSVVDHTTTALLGSPIDALAMAARFKRANAGTVSCGFAPCS